MKLKLLYIWILIFFGCQYNEEISEFPGAGNTRLTVHWDNKGFGSPSDKTYARAVIYDSEFNWKNSFSPFVDMKSLGDIVPPNGGVIIPVNSVVFENLEPKTYWIKIFNANIFNQNIDHNLNKLNRLENVLVKNTSSTIRIETQRQKLTKYTIKSITLNNIYRDNSIIGKPLRITFYRSPYYGYGSTSYYDATIIIQSLPFTINNLDIPITIFYGDVINIVNLETESTVYYEEFNFFDLLNQNMDLSGRLTKMNAVGQEIYTFNGEMILR